MSHPFDATLKDIYRGRAADLAPVLDLPIDLPCSELNVDLSTISAATDVAFGFGVLVEQIVDVNFQSGPDPQLPGRLHLYNAAYHHHEPVPVRSIVLLLRPTADHPNLTGLLAYQAGATRVEFHYEVVRLWQQPIGPFLTGGLGLLPLAPLCQLPADVPLEQGLRPVIHQIDQRLAAEAPYDQAVKLMTAAFVLTGLRAKRQTLADIFRGVKVMYESSAFELHEEKGRQEGLQEGLQQGLQQGLQKGLQEGLLKGLQTGRLEESRRLLLRQGTRRFGVADAATEAALRALTDLDRLERLADAMLTVASWTELLATP